MSDYTVVNIKPTGVQLGYLREAVGWSQRDVADIQKGLDGSLFAVCAFTGDDIIASARVVGDGCSVFYVQDVIVLPEYQGRGVGMAIMNRIMEFIGENACEGAVVGLMAAVGRESFYEQFGFHTRPNENQGAGMMQHWKRQQQ